MAQETRNQRGCFLLHVYAYFFGLGTGVIGTISLSNMDPPVTTWVLMPIGLLLGLTTCAFHIVCTCRYSENPLNVYKRSLLEANGLFLASAITYCGAFSYIKGKSLFFLCALFSATCYFMAAVALGVHLYQSWKKRKLSSGARAGGETTEESVPSQSNSSFLNAISMWSAAVPGAMLLQTYLENPSLFSQTQNTRTNPRSPSAISGSRRPHQVPALYDLLDLNVFHRDRQHQHESAVTQVTLSAVAPAAVALPSYSEVVTSSPDAPPKYSDISTVPGTDCVPPPETTDNTLEIDAPPDYESINQSV